MIFFPTSPVPGFPARTCAGLQQPPLSKNSRASAPACPPEIPAQIRPLCGLRFPPLPGPATRFREKAAINTLFSPSFPSEKNRQVWHSYSSRFFPSMGSRWSGPAKRCRTTSMAFFRIHRRRKCIKVANHCRRTPQILTHSY